MSTLLSVIFYLLEVDYEIFYENGHVRLQPENHTMAPIIVAHADVRGKLVALVRRF